MCPAIRGGQEHDYYHLLLVSTLLPKTEAWDLENMPDGVSGGRVSQEHPLGPGHWALEVPSETGEDEPSVLKACRARPRDDFRTL